jgi:drug/metabolite transporter (DMT)-like permease
MNKTKGIILVMLSAFAFGFVPLFAKIAYANGFNPYTLCFFRTLFSSVLLFIIIRLKGINYRLDKKHYISLLKISFIGYTITMLFLTTAYNYISTGLATTIHFIYPVAVMMGSIIFFKDKIDTRKIFSLLISIGGIYLLIGFGSLEVNILGFILALLSGITYSYYVLIVAYGCVKDMNSLVLCFYVALFNTYILFFASIITGNFNLNYTYYGLFIIMIGSIVSNLIGMVFFREGLKHINATTATIMSTFEPITSLVIGVIVFKELLHWYHFIGSALILLSVVIVAMSEKEKELQNQVGVNKNI